MKLQNKHKVMIVSLVVLVFIRYVFLPTVEWQQEKIGNIAVQNKQITKAERLIFRAAETQVKLSKIKESNIKTEGNYSHEASIQSFKLKQQQKIEALFTLHNIRVKNLNWHSIIPGEITQARINISFTGKTKDIAKLQLAISNELKGVRIVSWRFNISGIKERALGRASGTILLAAYYIPINEGLK